MKTKANDSIHNSEQGPQDGLTNREYFAAMAMQGICANANERLARREVAEKAVLIADHLIQQLNEKQP